MFGRFAQFSFVVVLLLLLLLTLLLLMLKLCPTLPLLLMMSTTSITHENAVAGLLCTNSRSAPVLAAPRGNWSKLTPPHLCLSLSRALHLQGPHVLRAPHSMWEYGTLDVGCHTIRGRQAADHVGIGTIALCNTISHSRDKLFCLFEWPLRQIISLLVFSPSLYLAASSTAP